MVNVGKYTIHGSYGVFIYELWMLFYPGWYSSTRQHPLFFVLLWRFYSVDPAVHWYDAKTFRQWNTVEKTEVVTVAQSCPINNHVLPPENWYRENPFGSCHRQLGVNSHNLHTLKIVPPRSHPMPGFEAIKPEQGPSAAEARGNRWIEGQRIWKRDRWCWICSKYRWETKWWASSSTPSIDFKRF